MDGISILGSYGNKSINKHTTAFLVDEEISIDAGNLSILGENISKLNHIFLTHSHFDHIIDIPFVIDSYFEKRKIPLKIYGLKDTIESIKEIFNNKIWPDFSKIPLTNSLNSVEFITITPYEKFEFKNITIIPFPAEHSVKTVGYKLIKNNFEVIISGDTYLHETLINEINNSKNLSAVLIETSFPNELNQLAKVSKHLTPELVKELTTKLTKNPKFYFYHFKSEYKSKIISQLKELNLIQEETQILDDGMCIFPFSTKEKKCTVNNETIYQELKDFIDIGVKLSKEVNIDYLLEDIMNVARKFTNADAGSIYLKEGDKLYFKIIQNDTLNTFMGGRKGDIKWPPLNMFVDGKENKNMVAVLCALTQKIYNIPDVYKDKMFDFSGTKKFDASTGYLSKTMLVIPLIDHKKETIGVLQLINKQVNSDIIPFSKDDEDITMALASQAAISITKNKLINDLENFIESFIKVIAKAVDEKSKYTGNHVQKVATLAQIMSDEINKDTTYYPQVTYSKQMLKQIKIAALLHDIGKITTDPRIMDKSTKLETTFDKIDLIKERLEIIKRDLLLKGENNFTQLQEDFEFIKTMNIGNEFVSDDKLQKLEELQKKYKYNLDNQEVSLIRDDELEMLKIRKGTLSDDERLHIQRHALMTLEMLSDLPFPREYKDITHIAANHHEKLNCKGYPRGLCEKDLTLEDKMLAICDIFEALTANDRPYKTPKKLSEVFKIMGFMAKDKEIDAELFEFFKEKRIWEKYKENLLEFQIDIE